MRQIITLLSPAVFVTSFGLAVLVYGQASSVPWISWGLIATLVVCAWSTWRVASDLIHLANKQDLDNLRLVTGEQSDVYQAIASYRFPSMRQIDRDSPLPIFPVPMF